MKILFIHGFVEDRTIFDQIRKTITSGEQIAINLNEIFDDWQDAPTDMDVTKLANHLVRRFQIGSEDCVIGHSMGGWIASYMKEQTGCKAILIASLTNQKKLITPVKNPTLVKYLIKWGVFQSNGMGNFLKKEYKYAESKQLYDSLIDGLTKMNSERLFQQFQVLFNKVKPLTIIPELRIHAVKDNIVAVPDESFVEVSGDHFCLVYYPQEVSTAILKVL